MLKALPCPCCQQDLDPRTFEGHYGAKVELDLCGHCEVVWFDRLENVQLSSMGVLNLLRAMVEDLDRQRLPLPPSMGCPRCQRRLLKRSGRTKNTVYTVHECPEGHGHSATWLEVLREKDCVRTLDAAQLEELKRHVSQVGCSGCGAPIDLTASSSCLHCSAPVSVLDHTALAETLGRLDKDAGERHTPSAELVAADMVLARVRTEQIYKELDRLEPRGQRAMSWGLMELGLEFLGSLLFDIIAG